MNFIRLLPVILSALLLAAHFLRAGQTVLMLTALALPLLLFVRLRWVPVVVTAALALGALEWIYTLTKIALIRADMGAPWARMALILGAVAAFTAGSSRVLRLPAIRARYRDARNQA